MGARIRSESSSAASLPTMVLLTLHGLLDNVAVKQRAFIAD
jgi:hypothetical protein